MMATSLTLRARGLVSCLQPWGRGGSGSVSGSPASGMAEGDAR